MDYTSSTSERLLLAIGVDVVEPIRSTAEPHIATSSTTTAVQRRSEITPRSPTNALPNAILAHQDEMARFEITRALYERLIRIAMLQDGWRGPSARALRSSSLRSFLQFWASIRDVAAEPEVALAPDGTIHAEWFKNLRQRLDIRFVDNKAVFGLFASNSVLEGAERPETVAGILKSHPSNPLSWRAV